MAKKKSAGVKKSEAVRDYLASNADAKPAEVVAAMKGQGIEVKAQFVSTIKTKLKNDSTTGRRGRPTGSKSKVSSAQSVSTERSSRPPKKANTSTEVSLDSLIKIKAMVDEMGGIENARHALSALEQLMD